MPVTPGPHSIPSSTWLSGARYWLKLATAPAAMAAATTLLTLAGTSLLYRTLPETQAGQLALLLALAELLSLVCAFGTPTLAIRVYSALPGGARDWPYDVGLTLVLGLIPAALSSALAMGIYELPPAGGAYLPAVLVLLTGLHMAAALLNAAGRYTASAVLLRLPNATLLGAWLAGLILPALSTLGATLAFHLGATLLALLAALALLVRCLPRGPVRIPFSQRREGLAFLGSSLAILAPDQGLLAVAGRLLTPPQLASFAAVAILLRPFRLVRSILGAILMPELIRRGTGGYRRHFVALGLLAAVAGLAAAMALPPLARWFYQERYGEGIAVIPILALAGVIHLTTVLPTADFSGRAPGPRVNRYVLSLILIVAAAMAAGAFGIARMGVLGLALAVLLAELAEGVVSIGFWLRLRHHERRQESHL